MSGVFIGLVPPPEVAELLAVPGGEPAREHHITLLYLGEVEDVEASGTHRGWLTRVVGAHAAAMSVSLPGRVAGYGVLSPAADKHALVALWDVPRLAGLVDDLRRHLTREGVPLPQDAYGLIAHETLMYSPTPITRLPEWPAGLPDRAQLGVLVLGWGGEWQTFPIGVRAEERCDLTDLARSSCGHCRPAPQVDWSAHAGRATGRLPRTIAEHHTRECPCGCGSPIEPGDAIVLTDAHGWVLAGCA
jgi:hypothetical protein